jgi:hypothetical protein
MCPGLSRLRLSVQAALRTVALKQGLTGLALEGVAPQVGSRQALHIQAQRLWGRAREAAAKSASQVAAQRAAGLRGWDTTPAAAWSSAACRSRRPAVAAARSGCCRECKWRQHAAAGEAAPEAHQRTVRVHVALVEFVEDDGGHAG